MTISEDSRSRFAHGLPNNATVEDKEDFAQYCMKVYQEEGYDSDSLSEYYAEDFESFSVDDFSKLTQMTRRNLRDYLRSHGVFVPKGRGVKIAEALHTVVHTELEWPENSELLDGVKRLTGVSDSKTARILKDVNECLQNEKISPLPQANERTTNDVFDTRIRKLPNSTSVRNEMKPDGNTRNLSALFKAYHGEKDKYTGYPKDNFDRKYDLFCERCEQVGISGEDRMKAVSIMLCGNAIQFYLKNVKGHHHTFAECVNAIKSRFVTKESSRSLLREWDTLTLNKVMEDNTEKSATDCLELLVTRLQEIQSSLPTDYHSDIILSNKLLNAISDVEACRLAYQKPADTLQGIISDLHSSLATFYAKNINATSNAFFIDRKFHNRSKHKKKCFVCKKLGCWSTNHPKEERLKAMKGNPRFRSFIAEHFSTEEESSDGESECIENIEDIFSHVISISDNSESSSDGKESPDSSENSENACAYVADLNQSATNHILTKSSYNYERYTDKKFFGVLIDTGCATASTGGEQQYIAYCRFVGQEPDIDTSSSTSCAFGVGKVQSKGIGIIHFPLRKSANLKLADDGIIEPETLNRCFFTSTEKSGDKSKNGRFKDSRQAELNGLIEQGIFEIVSRKEAEGHRIYGTRFVDTVKNEGRPDAYEKSRLVVQGYADKSHGLLTYAPTVQRASQRMLLAIAAMDKDLTIFSRDITQAYTQSKTKLTRKIFVQPPKELGLPPDSILRLINPLYGIVEAGNHWYFTYSDHHINKLNLVPSRHDPCLLYTSKLFDHFSKSPKGITCLQTDDSLSAANSLMLHTEEQHSTEFRCKERTILNEGKTLHFNGMAVTNTREAYCISVSDKIQRLALLNIRNTTKDEYISQRARGAYIAAVCRPDLTFAFSYAAQVVNPELKDFKFLNKHLNRCLQSSDVGMKFVKLNVESVSISVFVDASFAKNRDFSSQLGYVIALTDEDGNSNIIHYQSSKSKRVARSVLSAEMFAMVIGFDMAAVLRFFLNDLLNRNVRMNLFTDSRCLYDNLTTLRSTTEKRLLIDLALLRQCYERREIANVYWIPSEQNPADALTKDATGNALNELMMKNKIKITPNAWVERNK